MESALSRYKDIEHKFGAYYMNRLLAQAKTKLGTEYSKRDCKLHWEDNKKLLKPKKNDKKTNFLQQKHKFGLFVVRWLGDTFSIFLENPLISDMPTSLKPLPFKRASTIIKETDETPHFNFDPKKLKNL